MEDTFKKVVIRIFDNWTALNLAVEHSNSSQKSKEIITEFTNYMVQYCLYESNVDEASIEEALDDIMDQEFDTICEDNSTKEIAIILYKFLNLIKQENYTVFEEEYQKLPVSPTCSRMVQEKNNEKSSNTQESVEDADISNSAEVPMEFDSEWTVVKSRRKH